MIIASFAFLAWVVVGIIACKFNKCGGWLIMIADSNNTQHTWLAVPSLLLCWVLWPISMRVARFMFFVSISF